MSKDTPKRRPASKMAVAHKNKLDFSGVRTPIEVRRFHPARAIGWVAAIFTVVGIATAVFLATGAGNKAMASDKVIVEPVAEVQKQVPVSTTADEAEEPSLWEKVKAKYNSYFGDEPDPATESERKAQEILDEMEAEVVTPAPVPEPVEDEPVETDIAELTPGMVLAGVHAELNDMLNRNEKLLYDKAVEDAEQMDCMARALVFETGGQPELGQRWVYHTLKNRTDYHYRGNTTLCETVLDSKQVSAFNEDPDRRPFNETADVLQMVRLVNELYRDENLKDITCGATHYVRTDHIDRTDWAVQAMKGESPEGLVLKAHIGDHSFFGKEGCAHEHRIK